MPQYVLNRNYLLRTTAGCVAFEKNVPTWVTPEMQHYAQEIGAERVDGPAIDILGEEKVEPAPMSFDERRDSIFTAFQMLRERNDSKDFTGAGVPSVKAVEKITDFDVDRGEVADLWAEYRVQLAEA